MKARTVPLAEVIAVDRTAASETECQTLPYVGLEHIEKNSGHFTADFRRRPEVLLATKYRFTSRHVLYGKLRPNLNKTTLPDFDGVCTTEILPLLPRPQTLDRAYLHGALLSRRFVKWASNSVSGANLPRLDPDRLLEYEIELPDLYEQRRIARQLEQTDQLCRTRRFALELTDTFLPAAFIEFFGDPVKNAKGWPVVAVEEAGAVQLGRQRAPKYQTGKFRKPYIRVANVYENQIDLSDLLYMDFDASDCATYALEYGDILLNEGQSTELVGRPAMWRDEIPGCCFQNTLLRFQADRKVCEPTYALWLFIRYLRVGEFAKLSAKTSSVAHLGSYRLAQMRFPLAPLPLQQKFATLVDRVERLRAAQREALRQAEDFFASLLDQAFSG